MIESFPCPRCQRRLKRSGEITADGAPVALASFQCDECVQEITIGGATFEIALTFVVGADGRARNPETHAPL